MRHLNDKARLNRSKSHRKALLGNLSAALFTHKRIITTLAKAKYARRFAERMITFARRGDVAARRHVVGFIRDKEAVKLLFTDLGPHFKHRDGGYTRIIKIGPRLGDAAPMAILELVGFDDVGEVAAPKKESKSRLKAAQKAAVEEKPEKKDKKKPVEPEEAVAEVQETVTESEDVTTGAEAATEEAQETAVSTEETGVEQVVDKEPEEVSAEPSVEEPVKTDEVIEKTDNKMEETDASSDDSSGEPEESASDESGEIKDSKDSSKE
ncbi:50S ribosomal protein L17 [bacterium]|nr:50S ribosomal protein L17 [bacterium]